MEENKKDEKSKEEAKKSEAKTSTPDPKEGGKYETTPIIERAREEREKMDAANKKHEELLNREEQIMAKRALGGETEAGQSTEKKEETPKEYSEKVMKNEIKLQ